MCVCLHYEGVIFIIYYTGSPQGGDFSIKIHFYSTYVRPLVHLALFVCFIILYFLFLFSFICLHTFLRRFSFAVRPNQSFFRLMYVCMCVCVRVTQWVSVDEWVCVCICELIMSRECGCYCGPCYLTTWSTALNYLWNYCDSLVFLTLFFLSLLQFIFMILYIFFRSLWMAFVRVCLICWFAIYLV